MTKTMKIALTASALLAMSFTIGCSDDDPPPPDKYCVTKAAGVALTCTELDESFTAEQCKALAIDVGGATITAETTPDKPDRIECEKFTE